MRGTDKLNICETFYIYVGQWRTGRSRVCVTCNRQEMTKNLRLVLVQFSFDSRLVLVRSSFVLRSAFVHPSLDNRRSIEEQSKIYRKNNENTMEPQGNNLRAATNKHRMLRCALCAMLNGCLWQCWMLNVECWVILGWSLRWRIIQFWIVSHPYNLTLNI